MTLFIAALIAGFLTVLSPCVLPVLPIILGSSTQSKSKKDLVVIIVSLAVSIFVFTFLLRTSIQFLPILSDLGNRFWVVLSGLIIALFGVVTIFPSLWNKIDQTFGLNNQSHELLEKSKENHSPWQKVLLGASLGPVFTSCSPTYFVILGLVTSSDYVQGISLLVVYLLGLSIFLYIIGLLGFKATKKFGILADPNSLVRKSLGLLFVILGVGVVLGWDKVLETWLLDQGVYNGFAELEANLLQ